MPLCFAGAPREALDDGVGEQEGHSEGSNGEDDVESRHAHQATRIKSLNSTGFAQRVVGPFPDSGPARCQ